MQNANTVVSVLETSHRTGCAAHILQAISASSALPVKDFCSLGRTIIHTRSRFTADKIEAIESVRRGIRVGVV